MECTAKNWPGWRPPSPNCDRISSECAVHDVDALVLAVGEVHVLLLRVLRERDVPRRAVAERLRRDAHFLHELAVLREHLHAIVRPVADVDEVVVRELRAVHRRAELLDERRVRVVGARVRVVRLVAVRAPVALDLAGVGVDARRRACCRSRRRCRPRWPSGPRRSWRRGRSSRVSLLPLLWPGLPNCAMNLPSCVNFRTWESVPTLPPIQTLPL